MVVPQLDRVGGYEIQALQLSTSLVQGGNLVTILTDHSSHFTHKEFRSGFVIYRVPFRSKPTRWNVFFSLLSFLVRKRRLYDVVHVHGVTGFSLVASRIAWWLGLPVLVKAATKGDFSSIFSKQDGKHKRYQKWLQKVACFVAVSEELKQEIVACGLPEAKIRRIPNFVNTVKYVSCLEERKKALRAKRGIEDNRVIFLYLGRLVERKGVEYLLQAWQKAHLGTLWIVGSGENEEKLKRFSSEMQLKDVVFHGATQAPLDFYQSADVLVFPSLAEGSPNALLEALSCGIPCIATEIGGVIDMVQHGQQGLLVPPQSAEALAAAIQTMSSDPKERIKWGEEAARLMRRSYDVSVVSAQYVKLYDTLV